MLLLCGAAVLVTWAGQNVAMWPHVLLQLSDQQCFQLVRTWEAEEAAEAATTAEVAVGVGGAPDLASSRYMYLNTIPSCASWVADHVCGLFIVALWHMRLLMAGVLTYHCVLRVSAVLWSIRGR